MFYSLFHSHCHVLVIKTRLTLRNGNTRQVFNGTKGLGNDLPQYRYYGSKRDDGYFFALFSGYSTELEMTVISFENCGNINTGLVKFGILLKYLKILTSGSWD